MFHLYLSISCVSSWGFPASLGVLVFHVPMVMLSLPRIFDDLEDYESTVNIGGRTEPIPIQVEYLAFGSLWNPSAYLAVVFEL